MIGGYGVYDLTSGTNYWHLEKLKRLLSESIFYATRCKDTKELYEATVSPLEDIILLIKKTQEKLILPTFFQVPIGGVFVDIGGTKCQRNSRYSLSWLYHLDSPTERLDGVKSDSFNIPVSEDFSISHICKHEKAGLA